MSTPAPLHESIADHTAARPLLPERVKALVEAANDPARPDLESEDYFNPMWLIAIAGACLFGAMAALLALG